MPVLVGSAVEVRKSSMSPNETEPSLSNCLPDDMTVRFQVTRLNEHDGGVYGPTYGCPYELKNE